MHIAQESIIGEDSLVVVGSAGASTTGVLLAATRASCSSSSATSRRHDHARIEIGNGSVNGRIILG